LLTRSYGSQDSGANLVWRKTGATGRRSDPLDFLPLNTIDIKQYSDRPYWSYEGNLFPRQRISAGR